MKTKSPTDQILDYVEELDYSRLPQKTISFLKTHFLDTLGAIVAGSKADTSMRLLQLVCEWGGNPEGTIFVYNKKVPLINAAWINSTMARGYDFESIMPKGATHAPASIIPAALALSEYCKNKKGDPINGKEFLTSIALGLDLNFRLRVAGGSATAMGGGWLAETFAPLAIAALGGKLLRFERDTIRNAMGIAYNQCSGNYGAVVGEGGAYLAQASQGLGTKAGVLSVLLADIGFTASKEDIIDGRWGLYKMYGNGKYEPSLLLERLGDDYDHLKPIVKRYPGCGGLQNAVNTALEIVSEGVKPEDISNVTIRVSELNYYQLVHGRGKPPFVSEILWNERFAVALAFAKKSFSLYEINEEALKDPKVIALFEKIEAIPDNSLKGEELEMEVTTLDSLMIRKKKDALSPLTDFEILQKFKNCCKFSLPSMSEEQIDEIISTVTSLENLEDVSDIFAIFKG
ncbi:MAG: MmgE/PrpD family protein [Candidatus Methanomethyliaceae archaeon]